MSSRTTASPSRPVVATVMAMVLATLSAAVAAPGTAAPAPTRPGSASDVGTFANSNPIDWTQVDWFINHQGDGFPLRVGQHDDGARDGFGQRHIIDGHTVVPDRDDIQEAVADPGACWYTFLDERWRCHSSESLVFVSYSTQPDDRSPDSDPFGIITAYYMLPPATCGPTAAAEFSVQCETEPLETSIDYRGPDQAVNGESLEVSARLGDDLGIPKTGQPLVFSLGTGADRQTCEAATSGAGVAACTIDNVSQPVAVTVPLRVEYAGNTVLQPSSTEIDLALQTPTTVAFTGPEYVANGENVTLTAVLTDYRDRPVEGSPVTLTIGAGANAQACTGTTNGAGEAACAIEVVDQPLNAAASVPATAVFSGSSAYTGSDDATTVKLEHYTGRSYGLKATVDLLVLPVNVQAQPDTGNVRTATESSTSVPCTTAIAAIVVRVETLCPTVRTTLAPGTITSTSTVEHASIGLPGLPVIDIAGLATDATATCDELTGSTSLTLRIGGIAAPVPTTPNTVIDLAAGVRLAVNEQVRSDSSITVTGARLSVAGTDTDIVVGHSTAAVHNCAP